MDPAVPIHPQPGLRIVAAIALHAVIDRLVVSYGFGGDDSADDTDRGTSGRRTTSSTASSTAPTTAADDSAAANTPLHFLHDVGCAQLRLLSEIFRYAA